MIASIADLTGFLRRFHRHWLDDPSLDPSSIPGDLPDGLARVYRELGALVEKHPGPFNAQDALIPVGRLDRVDGMVEFAAENQGNWTCRCPLGPGDPPVYSDAADLIGDEQQGFVVVCESLDHFLTTLSLQEAVMSCRYLFDLAGDPPMERLKDFGFRPLWLAGQYVHDEPSHDFYELPGQEALLLRHRYEGTVLGTPSIEDLGERLARIGMPASRF